MSYVKIVTIFDDVKYAFYVNKQNMSLLAVHPAMMYYMTYLRASDYAINLDTNTIVKCRLTLEDMFDKHLNL